MIEKYYNALDIPKEWDELAKGNFALLRENLIILEKVNPCFQTYVIFKEEEYYFILVQYKLKLNIFCYKGLNLNINLNIIGIPISVSEKGYSFIKYSDEIKNYIKSIRGGVLILNAKDDLNDLGFSKGSTLPTCILDIKWKTFDEYLNSIRSHYRYRYIKALEKVKGININNVKEFNENHYNLYLNVYKKSEYKLEKLSIDFFKEAKANIVEFKKGEKVIAFLQYTIYERKLIFLFGGLEYSLNKENDLYLNMLLHLVRVAIENDCISINLGQTAEEMKCKLGSYLEKKYIYVNHSNPFIRLILPQIVPILSYKTPNVDFEVFKR